MPPLALEQLPHDILTHIAFYTAVGPACRSAAGPPKDLLHLLLTCRVLHRQLCKAHNSALYASIFHALFDTAALARRFGALTPRQLAEGLVERFMSMKTLRAHVLNHSDLLLERCDAAADRDLCQNLWTIYLMALEHGAFCASLTLDTRNLSQLQWCMVDDFVDIHALQTVRAHHIHARLPTRLPTSSLVLHLRFALTQLRHGAAPADGEHQSLFLLVKPYVFATHEYNMYFARWQAWGLPHASLDAQAQVASVRYLGQELLLAVPPVSQAATLLMFERHTNTSYTSVKEHLGRQIEERLRTTSVAALLGSAAFDLDFKRLDRCYDPAKAPGLHIQDHRNKFEGVWEGQFSFFDFASYRDMLSGSTSALFDGGFGEQSQVLHLHETCTCASSDAQHSLNTPDDAPLYVQKSAAHGALPATELDSWRVWEASFLGETPSATDEHALLLHGTGHSAWGKFYVRGRVRTWDGLVMLLKEYGPGRQGKWIYCGYRLAGGKMVGRWRDAYTPQSMHGYEGPFFLTQRACDAQCAT